MARPLPITDSGNSEIFKIKKWALFAACVLAIFISVTMTALTNKLVKSVTTEKHDYNERTSGRIIESINSYDEKTTRGPWVPIYYIAGGLSIAYYLLGLFAAYTGHYYVNVTFAVLTTLSAILNILTAIDTPAYWASVVINLVVCGLSYAFTYDLRLIRIQANAQPVYTAAAVKEQE